MVDSGEGSWQGRNRVVLGGRREEGCGTVSQIGGEDRGVFRKESDGET